jgi:hypothetical protein
MTGDMRALAVVALGAIAIAACGRPALVPGVPSSAGGSTGGGAGGAGNAAGAGSVAGAGSAAGAGVAVAGAGGSDSVPAPPGDTTANPRFVFVSSQVYQGGALGGLEGADAKCQALASAAGLPGTYQAWLGDLTGSPSTRFRRDGGPFRLVGGELVAESWRALTTGPLHHAIDRTETGGPPPETMGCGWTGGVWTDTAMQGFTSSGAGNCSNWSDSNATGAGCGLMRSQTQWTGAVGGAQCHFAAAIYCFEQDGPDLGAGDAGAPETAVTADAGAPPSPKTVFVTSQAYTGDLGGLAGADAKCQALAAAAGLPGTYFAWVSDFFGSPSTRFSRAGRPYRLVDGSVVADDWKALTSGTLRHAIDLTETGGAPPMTASCSPLDSGALVWTDTSPDGSFGGEGYSCGDWTDAFGDGSSLGLSSDALTSWTLHCVPIRCAANAALYCFEQ